MNSATLAGALLALGPCVLAARAPDDAAFVRSPTLKVVQWHLARPAVALEYPARDWIEAGAGVTTLATFTQRKGEASMVLEYEVTDFPTPVINDTFLELERDRLGSVRQVEGLTARVLPAAGRSIAIFDYTEQGTTRVDRVRTYVMPLGRQVFRLICRASATTFQQYHEVFSHAASSLVIDGAH